LEAAQFLRHPIADGAMGVMVEAVHPRFVKIAVGL
jgi:hypothetical protein